MATYTVVKGDTFWKIAEDLLGDGALWKNLIVNGKPASEFDPKSIKAGWTITTSASGSTDTAATTATGGQSLNNIGGTPEVWKVGTTSFLVYTVPGTEDDPVYIAWEVPSDSDLQSFFGPDQPIVYNKQITEAAYNALGVLEFGSTDELVNTSEDPFSTWANDMEMLSQTQPWILDADYQALVAMSIMEGRELTQAELATTDWWQNHSAAQREWMVILHGDPSTADQKLADAKLVVSDLLTAAGAGADPGEELVAALAMNWVSGNWTQTYLQNQVTALTDPFSGIAVDAGIADLVPDAELTQTISAEDTVRDLLHTWLGPMFGAWDDAEIARIAGDIRNDPNAEQKFIESLKDQRMALFPEYSDRELSYAAISNTWRQWWMGQWGQAPDENSDLWMTVLKNNDTASSGKLLRAEGINQGVGKVLQDFSGQTVRQTSSERNPIFNG